MLKPFLIAPLCLLFAAGATRAAATLTAQETRWLVAAGPVLAYSQRLHLPIDIIVQPRPRPGDVPLAMGFDGRRCKLVLSIRGNPDAETILVNVPQARRGLLIEAMAAHEVGHCWRYASGVWRALPAGFVETGEQQAGSDQTLAEARAMRESRREEGFADLVALAWTARHHAGSYAEVYAWLDALRGSRPQLGGAHDTHAWVALARERGAFCGAATPFDDAAELWRRGLLLADKGAKRQTTGCYLGVCSTSVRCRTDEGCCYSVK